MRVRLLVVSLALAAGAGCAGLPRHPDFKARQKQMRTLAILPPKVEILKVGFRGSEEPMNELVPGATLAIAAELDASFAQRGYALQPLDLQPQTLEEHPELKQDLYLVLTAFEKQMEAYRKKGLRKGAFTYNVGSTVNTFADRASSDTLVLLRCHAIKKTGGEIAKDWAKTVLIAAATLGNAVVYSYSSVTLLELAVLDGNSGDILWYTNNAQFANVDAANTDHLRKAVRSLVKQFPKAAPPPMKDLDGEAP